LSGEKPYTLALYSVGLSLANNPYYKDALMGVEVVGDHATVSLEKIASLNPDLIITYQEETYEQISKIAPTVFIPWGKYDYRERLIEIGKILNKEQQAVQWVADFNQKLEEKKTELADLIKADKKVAIFEIAGKELFLYGSSYGRGGEILYNGLGLHAPKLVEDVAFKEGWASISHEALPAVKAGHVFAYDVKTYYFSDAYALDKQLDEIVTVLKSFSK
jgi:iron complex transport system substrate-binding protein